MTLDWGKTVRRLVALAALVMASLSLSLVPAAARDGSLLVDLPTDSHGFVHAPDAPLVDVHRLAPGYSGSSTFAVRNTSAYDAHLVMTVLELTDEENGCVGPESRTEGDDCETSGGELSGWLTATVSLDDQAATTLWSGDLTAMLDGVELTDALGAGATWPLRVTLSMPAEATNATMTDQVSFSTRLTAESEYAESEVAGPVGTVDGSGTHGTGPVVTNPLDTGAVSTDAQAGPTPGSGALGSLGGGPPVALPMTGGTVGLWLLLLDAFVLLCAAVLLWVGRGARRAPAYAWPRA